MTPDRSPPPDAAVAQLLPALKRRGGVVLVVGAAGRAHAEICERFLGDDEKKRVVFRTDGIARGDDEGGSVDRVVDRQVPTRSATGSVDADPNALSPLLAEFSRVLSEEAVDDADLRACFDSLRPFADGVTEPSLTNALGSFRETALETGAVVHVHLPVMLEVVPLGVFDAVDAVVELSERPDGTYQRWHLPDREHATNWVEV
jgi:NAD(P)-dependent dehydrogenase (short-subunit alcohol dehydrogenase family)